MAALSPLVLPSWHSVSAPAGASGFFPAALALPERTVMADLERLRELIRSARQAAARAYAPFSRFHVGAALEMADDPAASIFTGANVENSSYGLTMCAERTALHHAVSRGFRRLKHLAVSCASVSSAPLQDRSPCGACRQVIREFADEHTLVLLDRGGDDFCADVLDIDRLLPFGFKFTPPGHAG